MRQTQQIGNKMYALLLALALSLPLRATTGTEWSLEMYYKLRADATCCPTHGDEASCDDEGGSNCIWFNNPNDPIPNSAKSQCVGRSYAKCKRDNGITACCAPGCPGGGGPKPTQPGGGGGGDPTGPVCGPSSAGLTPMPTTRAPTTKAPTTRAPTTRAPTTRAPTTRAPTTRAPTTRSPTTRSPTTRSPTTRSPTTRSPTTRAPTTRSPTTRAPTTRTPTTRSPTTRAPTTRGPTTRAPTTRAPTTRAPTTRAPTTRAPTTRAPTTRGPTTRAPTTRAPTTRSPTTRAPTTRSPTTRAPTTRSPTTRSPTTRAPTTREPTTRAPTTRSPTTRAPTTRAPTTRAPTTRAPTTRSPTTRAPTTRAPTTRAPTTGAPTTKAPTTKAPTTPAPVEAPGGTPSPTKNPVSLGPDCELGTNYAFEGYPCQINGDPHFVLFNGGKHDYQGQPKKSIDGLLRNQYYYMTQCDGASLEQMPFRLLGSHYAMYPTVTGMDVLTFELFDTATAIMTGEPDYYLHVHPEFVKYTDGPGCDSDYDLNTCPYTDIDANNPPTYIGSRFSVSYTRQSANTIIFRLTIDDTNEIDINLNGQNGDSTRYRMQYAVVQVPPAYKCRTCGLCGDFNNAKENTPDSDGRVIAKLFGCDGEVVGIREGLSAEVKEAYDIYGLSFEKYYWQNQCTSYDPTSANFTYIEPCDANIKTAVKDECKKAVFRKANCCNNFPDICQDLQADCVFDACVLSTDENGNGDTTLIEQSVMQAFDVAFNEFCDLAENSQLFGTPIAGGDVSQCKKAWEQCGGTGYTGVTCCKLGYECAGNVNWMQCTPLPAGSGPCQDNWGQCYGVYWNGKECCNDGFACIRDTEFYSQCLEIPDNLSEKAEFLVNKWIYGPYNHYASILQNDGYMQITITCIILLLFGAIYYYRKRKELTKDDKYIPILKEAPTRWSNKVYTSYNNKI